MQNKKDPRISLVHGGMGHLLLQNLDGTEAQPSNSKGLGFKHR